MPADDRIDWRQIGVGQADDAQDCLVVLFGYPVGPTARSAHALLLPEPPCCGGCLPADPLAGVEVFATAPLPLNRGAMRLRGRWDVRRDGAGWRYGLHEAQALDPPGWAGVTRRGVLAAGPLMCFAANARAEAGGSVQAVLGRSPSIDIHSHAGGIANVMRIRAGVGFSPIANPMRAGRVAVACLAVVSDGPTHRIGPDGLLHPFREPEPGELAAYGDLALGRLLDLTHTQGLALIADAAGMRAARAGVPSVVIAAEGADFLEGRLDGLEGAYANWALRHLQLTHYRVNALGDVQTEAPVHDGLTDFGAAVIRDCNQRGIVVDVAHGTLPLVRRAAEVTSKPLVLSHTSLARSPGPRSRQITAEHAKVMAGTGGVIGVWPPVSVFPSLTAMAAGIARMVDAAGIDHVGIGTDMRGLTVASVLPDYDAWPGLAEALLAAGFNGDEAAKLLGGNYARVFMASVG